MNILAFVIIVGFLHLLLVKNVNSWSWDWLTRWFTSERRKIEKDSKKTLQIPLSVSKSISEVAATGAVFLRDSAKLNCLGLPTKLFANTIYSSDTEAEDVRFYFFSQKTPGYSDIKIEDDFTLEHVDYSVYRDTIVLVHGFMSSGKEQWLVDMKDAFLKYDDVNVIVVDWHKGSNTWNYIAATANTQIVGQQIASLFARIRQFQFDKNVTNVADWGKIHFIGHSLGSHISARAAYGIHESQWNRPDQPSRSAWNVSRITGLDPAQPCFVTADETLKLGKDDAEYVDVIHTNARQLIHLGLGLPEQLGFVDFYPNGGQIQPGCSNVNASFWDFLLLPNKLVEASICSHGRSHSFLTESVLNAAAGNCSFIGHRWDRKYEHVEKLLGSSCTEDICPEMGITSIISFPRNGGIFFVPTGDLDPFCSVKEEQKKIIKKQLKNDKALEKSLLTRFGDKVFG